MIYRFDDFALDTDRFELGRGEDTVALEPQVFEVLAYLIAHSDRIVAKAELIDAVWQGRAISDSALNSRINSVRRAVGDSGATQTVIKTYPRRGFRFVAAVTQDGADGPQSWSGQSDKPSIAVLPFANLSNDPDQDYFSDGIAEDIITALSRIRQFRVVARNSAFSFKGTTPDMREVAEALDARYLVEGSVRKAGNRVRVSARLLEGRTGDHIWAERYDRELEDIFALQDELTTAIVAAVEPALGNIERDRARTKPLASLTAWDLCLRGTWLVHKREKGPCEEARALFERAIEIAPNYGPAHAGLAQSICYDLLLGFSERDLRDLFGAAGRAVELDDSDANARIALGEAHWIAREHDAAIRQFEAALALNPNLPWAYHMIATALAHNGRAAEAVSHLHTALRLAPRDYQLGAYQARLAMAHLFLGQHEDSVTWSRRAVGQRNIAWPAHIYLISALGHLGRAGEAGLRSPGSVSPRHHDRVRQRAFADHR